MARSFNLPVRIQAYPHLTLYFQIHSFTCPPIESSSTDMLCLKELILTNAPQATVRGVVGPGTRKYHEHSFYTPLLSSPSLRQNLDYIQNAGFTAGAYKIHS